MNGRDSDAASPPADVVVLVGDCLRAADATAQTTPFLRDFADATADRCYAPSTWTLPAHASLYATETPLEHEVTRRGQGLSPSQARLPRAARAAGYRTALFSENPTFSSRYGFHHGVDFADDFVNSKLLPADFALENEVESVSASALLEGARALLDAPGRLRNLVNGAYAPLSYAAERWTDGYPHHGDRVLSHLDAYLADGDDPAFAVVNLLDPHNPHHAPPERGAEALGVSVSDDERSALASLSDNKRYLFGDEETPPTESQDRFDSWDAAFERRRDVYRTQVRYFDLLLEEWIDGLDDEVRRNSLFVVTGDHGQLFGEEGMVGHHTSLHPRGVEVPLWLSFPSSWDAPDRIEAPVGWIGLSRALADVFEGRVTSGEEFVAALRRESTVDGSVVVAADGPTWNVERLRSLYPDDRVDEVAVRKVGLIDGDRQVVYESGWDDDAISKSEYELVGDDRELLSSTPDAEPAPRYREWLVGERAERADPEVSARLEQLGYL